MKARDQTIEFSTSAPMFLPRLFVRYRYCTVVWPQRELECHQFNNGKIREKLHWSKLTNKVGKCLQMVAWAVISYPIPSQSVLVTTHTKHFLGMFMQT